MYSLQQILSFAPDKSSAERAQELATTRKWRSLEGSSEYIWGECKSSGASYYKSSIQLKGPKFYCSCPSRKFPCKHVIGLFILYFEQPDAFRVTDPLPEWVQKWLTEQANPKKKEETTAKNARQRQKKIEKRLQLMATGLDDLEQWIEDAIAAGLAATKQKPLSFWESLSARMVDAQLAGISRKLKTFPLISTGDLNWPEKMLAELANIYLIIKGFKKLDQLPHMLRQDLLSFTGVNIRKDTVFEQPPIKDKWIVIGSFEGVDDLLSFRRTWFMGLHSQKTGLLLEFNYGDSGFNHYWKIGTCYEAEGFFYPSNYPLRFLLSEDYQSIPTNDLSSLQGFPILEDFLKAYAGALAANPWISNFPALLNEVTPIIHEDQFYLIDQNEHYIPLHYHEKNAWKVIALSGGHPINLFGEWTGERLIPLSIVEETGVVAVSS